MRLQKYLADAGVASRRSGERLILEGRVTVNGVPVNQLGTQIDPHKDTIELDGKSLRPRPKIYVALNKPRGYLCTRRDPEHRKTVFKLLPKEWSNVYPIGRLDSDSEGLLLLTNDGEFCLRISHPRYRVTKTYLVLLTGRITPAHLERLRRGITDRGEKLKAIRTSIKSANNSHSVVEIELAEGKNREVRRMFAALQFPVEKLCRTRIGSLRLGELPAGKWRVLNASEIRSFEPTADPHSSPLIEKH